MKYLILVVLYFGRGSGLEEGCTEVETETDATVISSGLTFTFGTELHKQTIGVIEENNSEASRTRVNNLAEATGIGLMANEEAVNNEENIARLCSLNDRTCIRTIFSRNSNCTQALGPISDPVFLAQNTVKLSSVNVTATLANYTIRGLSSGNIVELYNNTVTKQFVFAFQVRNVNMTARNAFFGFQRPGRETFYIEDTLSIFLTTVVFTVIIPSSPQLRLDLAEAHAYIPEVCPSFTLGPNLYNSENPTVVEAYQSILSSIPVIVKEIFLLQAQLLTAIFIQDSVCDFGIKLYSV